MTTSVNNVFIEHAASQRAAQTQQGLPPAAALPELEIATTGAGMILRSPNGIRWRVTVNNSGTLVVAAA